VSRYGGIVVVIARYIVGLREANGIIAGITQMRWVTYAVYNLIGTCAWVATWVTIGDVAGKNIDTIYKDINRYSIYLLIVLVVLLAAYIVRRVVRRRHKIHEAPASPGAQESPDVAEELEAGKEPEAGERPEVPGEPEAHQDGPEARETSRVKVPKPGTQGT
jgi:hypothetical protein